MRASFPSMMPVCTGFSRKETPSLPGPASTRDSFCHCSSEGPGTASPLAFSSLAFSFDFFFDFFFILFFFFLLLSLSLSFARFFLLCRLFFVLESLSLVSPEEELEEEEDEEELVDEDAGSEEEVLAFLFFLSFPSFFFSAVCKKRLNGAAQPHRAGMLLIPLPAWFLSCLNSKAPKHKDPDHITACGARPAHEGLQGSALVRTRLKWAQSAQQGGRHQCG